MKKLNRKKTISLVSVLILLVFVYLVYSRPMTVSQLYPMLSLEKCTEIRGYYRIGVQTEQTEFTVDQDSEEFQKLCSLFYEQEYRRSFRDLLPRGTRIHRTEPDDFQWDVSFCFEDVEFPDGSSGSGALLHFQNWYGELDIDFNAQTHSCYVNEQEAWAQEILDIIQQTP